MNMKITISGTLGSGKSTVAKIVAQKLRLKQFNSGQFMRDIANKRGLTLLELQELSKNDRSIDDETDTRQKELGEKEDNFVFEGRLGYHFIPDSFKVFLKTGVEIAALRILESMKTENLERKKEGLVDDKDEIIAKLKRRRDWEKNRYKELYSLDYEDEKNYNLIIDTTSISAEEVSEIIIGKLSEKYKKNF